MVHRIAHRLAHANNAGQGNADHAAHHDGALTRIQSAVIFGSIGSGLLACALGSIVYDIGRAFAAW